MSFYTRNCPVYYVDYFYFLGQVEGNAADTKFVNKFLKNDVEQFKNTKTGDEEPLFSNNLIDPKNLFKERFPSRDVAKVIYVKLVTGREGGVQYFVEITSRFFASMSFSENTFLGILILFVSADAAAANAAAASDAVAAAAKKEKEYIKNAGEKQLPQQKIFPYESDQGKMVDCHWIRMQEAKNENALIEKRFPRREKLLADVK